jgi:outer membrane beta-barrel protein
MRAAFAHSSPLFMMGTHPSIALFERTLERPSQKKPHHGEIVRKAQRRALPGPRGRDYGYALGRATIILALCTAVAPLMVLSFEVRANAAARSRPGAAADSPFDEDATPVPGDDDDGEGASDRSSEAEAGGTPGAALHALACLEGEGGNDNDGARRGVQKRDFIKRHRVELSLLGGHYAADMLSSTYTYGAAVTYWLSEDFGVEALLARNPVQYRLEQPFTGFDREHHFQSGTAWNAMGAMVWAPIHAKLRWSERRITHADLSWVVGAGRTFNDTAQGLTLQVGVGLRLFLARYLSLRLDLRDLAIPEEVLGRGRTSHNIVTLVGLCGWFPG